MVTFLAAAIAVVTGFLQQCRLSMVQVLGHGHTAHWDTDDISRDTDDVALSRRGNIAASPNWNVSA